MKKNITIDIYSDTICPWCYIGLNKLNSVINSFPNKNFILTWRPFQLNLNMPLEGIERAEYLKQKFNNSESAKKMYKSIYEEGIKNNIYKKKKKITITPNSFASHKLLALAHKFEKQTEVAETLFYEYFIEGVDIGNLNQLIRIAKQHSIFSDNTIEYLQSEEDKVNLLAEETHARTLGIKGVPCFIINKEYVLFGVQDESNFVKIFSDL